MRASRSSACRLAESTWTWLAWVGDLQCFWLENVFVCPSLNISSEKCLVLSRFSGFAVASDSLILFWLKSKPLDGRPDVEL